MDYAKESLRLHGEWGGKIEVVCTVPCKTKEDLSLAYTPGVAQPCLEIQKDVNKSYELTRRHNLCAVITDGTAVLGLGDIGPEAGMPVMEGKCALFKKFADVDAFLDSIFAGFVELVAKAANIFALNQVKHIELTPDILLTDGKVRNERGGVSICGEEYVEQHTIGWKHILVTAFFAIVAAIPVINLIREFSVAMLIYTIFKIALMLYRMYSGYARGAKGYNAIEPKHLQDKIKYLGLYLEFLEKKIYLTLKDKYNIVGEDFIAEDQRKDTVDESRAGGDRRECGDHGDPA